MTVKDVQVPNRISEDIVKNGGRETTFFLRGLKEKIDSLSNNLNETSTELRTNITSTQDSVTTIIANSADSTPPSNVTGLSLSSVVTQAQLYVSASLVATWNAAVDDSGKVRYEISYYPTSDPTKVESTFTNNTTYTAFPVQVGVNYTFSVRAVDFSGNFSTAATATHTIVGDTTPPNNVTGFTGVQGLTFNQLSWVNPTNTDFIETLVYRGTSAGFTADASSQVYRGRGTTFIDDNLTAGTGYYYKTATIDVTGNQSSASSAFGPYTPFTITAGNVTAYIGSQAIGTNQITDAAISTGKFSSGIEPVTIVSSVPGTLSTKAIFNTTDGKLYRWNGSSYVATVPTVDLTGQITTGQITNQAVDASKIADAALTTAKFASGIEPVTIVSSVPGSLSTKTIFNTTDGKLYRWNGSAYVNTVPTVDLTGQVTTGQITDSAVTSVKLNDLAVTAAKLNVTMGGANMVSNSSFEIDSDSNGIADSFNAYTAEGGSPTYSIQSTGRYGTKAQRIVYSGLASGAFVGFSYSPVAGLDTTKPIALSCWVNVIASSGAGQTFRLQANGTLTLVNLPAAGSGWVRLSVVYAAGWAAGSTFYFGPQAGGVPAGGTIDFDGLQVEQGDVVTAYAPRPDEILPGTVGNTELAALSVTASKIAANTITAAQIAGNTITAAQIAANTITADQLYVGVQAALNDTPDNMLDNGGGEEGTVGSQASGWTLGGGNNLVCATDQVKYGSRSLKISNPSTTDSYSYQNIANVVAGAVYEISGWIKTSSLVGCAATLNVDIISGITSFTIIEKVAYSSASFDPAQPDVGVNSLQGGGTQDWVQVRCRFIPNGADGTLRVYAQLGYAAAGTGTAWFDGITFRRLYSIVTNDIAANAITAGKIAVGTITSNEIASNTITANNIAASTITGSKIAANTITASNIAANTITASQIAADTITASQIAANAITSSELAANSVVAGKIAAAAVSATEIAAGAITTNKLFIGSASQALNDDPYCQDQAAWTGWGANTVATVASIGFGKVGNYALTVGPNIFSRSINARIIPCDPARTYRLSAWVYRPSGCNGVLYLRTVEYAAGEAVSAGTERTFGIEAVSPTADTWVQYQATFSPTAGKVGFTPHILINWDGTAGTMYAQDVRIDEVLPGTLIQNGAITASKIQAATITSNEIASNTITAGNIAASTITGAKIAAGTITASNIAADTITANEIASNAITSNELAANSVVAGKIAAGTIVAADIAAATITGAKIAANTIAASNIVASTITSNEIASNTILAANIAAATITGAKIAASTITASNLTVSQLSAITADLGSITAGTVTGATVQTASSGQRVALDSTNGIRTINSGATTTSQLAIDGSGFVGRTASGGTAISWDTNGDVTLGQASTTKFFSYQDIITTTGAGSILIPKGARLLTIRAWGAGGGGGRSSSAGTYGSGGASGAAVKKSVYIRTSDWGGTISYSVGTGGTGGATNGANGTAGTATTVTSSGLSFTNLNISAGGGPAGAASGATTSTATASGGDTNTNGFAGTGGASASTGANSPTIDAIFGAGTTDTAPGVGEQPGGGGNGTNAVPTANNGGKGMIMFVWS